MSHKRSTLFLHRVDSEQSAMFLHRWRSRQYGRVLSVYKWSDEHHDSADDECSDHSVRSDNSVWRDDWSDYIIRRNYGVWRNDETDHCIRRHDACSSGHHVRWSVSASMQRRR